MVDTITPEELKQEAERAYKKKNYLASARAFQASAKGYTQIGAQLEAAEMLNNASVAFLQGEQPEPALDSALKTDQIFAAAGDVRRQAIALGNQAAAYEALDQLESAADTYQVSANLLMEIGDQEFLPTVMRSLSAVQLRLGRQMEALVTMHASLEQAENPGIRQKLLNKVMRSPFIHFNH